MGVFGRLFVREKQLSPFIEDPLLRALFEGETIDKNKALTLPVVSGAVDLIANSVASIPVRLYRKNDDRIEIVEDRRVDLLNCNTGDALDGFQLKKALVSDYLLDKGGYAYIERIGNDTVALRYVKSECVSFFRENFDPIFKNYRILVQGRSYFPFQFIKLLRNTQNGMEGVGLTSEIGRALETSYATLLYQLNLVRTGGSKRGFLTSENRLAQEELDNLRTAWQQLYTGSADKTFVLNKGVSFQELSNSAVDNQINESRKFLSDEINKLFHIHDDFLLTFKEAIYPVLKAFETALNRDLLLESEKSELYFAFDTKDFLKTSLKERYEAYKLAKDTGFMTLNEIRKEENLDRITGLDLVNVGLSAVLLDVDSGKYFTPNTGLVSSFDDGAENNVNDGLGETILE